MVLVPFEFSDGSGLKKRPAVILSIPAYHASRADAVMLALTSQTGADYLGECTVLDWRAAGLLRPTKAKGVLRTIQRSMIDRKLGDLTPGDLIRVRQSVKDIFGFA